MVLKLVDDVLLQEVAEGLKELATCIRVHLPTAASNSSSSSGACWLQIVSGRLLLERLLLLHCRSEIVLAEFSEYYCLRVLLDIRSPLATYFIDLFHQLEWLLEALLMSRMGHSDNSDMSLPQDLYCKASKLLRCIRPAVSSCRHLFLQFEMSKPDRSAFGYNIENEASSIAYSVEMVGSSGREELKAVCRRLEKLPNPDLAAGILRRLKKMGIVRRSTGMELIRRADVHTICRRAKQFEIEWRKELESFRRQEETRTKREGMHISRKAKAHRDLSRDSYHAGLKLLPFVNLDKYSKYNRVELGRKLGEGNYAVVYKGNFVIRNNSDKTKRILGPVAVKVFKSCQRNSGSCESTGSRFFNQMEAMVKLKESAHSTSSSNYAAECCKMSYRAQGAMAFHDSFDQMEKKITDEELSEELWKLVTAKHPNVISALGYIGERDEGESGLVMELMSTSLHSYLVEVAKPYLQELEMVDIMLETAKGMRFLHECDLVHRDLKPQNILLRFDKQSMINRRRSMYIGAGTMEVKLADFGLAQRLVMGGDGSETDTCERAGTYCYMAPELLEEQYQQPPAGSNNKDKMDVFSYGTTCFNILTCYKDAGGLNELIRKAGSKRSAAPFYKAVESNEWRVLVQGKPDYLIDLIAKCWAFDPCQRPTFAEICCLLQRAMLCILAPPVIDEQAFVRTLSRNVLADVLEPIMQNYPIMLEPIVQSSDEPWPYEVIGTSWMEKRLWNLVPFVNVSIISEILGGSTPLNRFLGELRDYAIALREQWSNYINEHSARSELASVRILLRQQEERLSRSAGAQQLYLQIPLTTTDTKWNACVFKALVWCSICSHFDTTNIGPLKWIRESSTRFYPGSRRFAFENDGAKTDLDVDQSLMPFLECFWESGYVRPPRDKYII